MNDPMNLFFDLSDRYAQFDLRFNMKNNDLGEWEARIGPVWRNKQAIHWHGRAKTAALAIDHACGLAEKSLKVFVEKNERDKRSDSLVVILKGEGTLISVPSTIDNKIRILSAWLKERNYKQLDIFNDMSATIRTWSKEDDNDSIK